MEQQPTVNIAGVQVPIRGLPENDARSAPKKPPPKKLSYSVATGEQACRRVLEVLEM